MVLPLPGGPTTPRILPGCSSILMFESSLHISDFTLKSWSPSGRDWFYYSIEAYGTTSSEISGNKIINSGGMFIEGASDSIISGNLFTNIQQTELYISAGFISSTDNVITDNIVNIIMFSRLGRKQDAYIQ